MLSLYWMCAGFGCVFTSTCNWLSADRIDPSLKQRPLALAGTFALKGLVNGILWPTIPLQIYYDENGFLIPGEGIEKHLINRVSEVSGRTVDAFPRWKTPD